MPSVRLYLARGRGAQASARGGGRSTPVTATSACSSPRHPHRSTNPPVERRCTWTVSGPSGRARERHARVGAMRRLLAERALARRSSRRGRCLAPSALRVAEPPCVDVALERLCRAVVRRRARGPLGDVRREHGVARRRAARGRARPASPTPPARRAISAACAAHGRGQQVGGVAVPPSAPEPQQVADDELRMVVGRAQERAASPARDRARRRGRSRPAVCPAFIRVAHLVDDDGAGSAPSR